MWHREHNSRLQVLLTSLQATASASLVHWTATAPAHGSGAGLKCLIDSQRVATPSLSSAEGVSLALPLCVSVLSSCTAGAAPATSS